MDSEKLEHSVSEVYQNIDSLMACVEHLRKMFNIASNCYYGDDNKLHHTTDCNLQALTDVEQFAKKVSSRADILQNNIFEYSKLAK